jgi:GNAT superfamily N-acetyltransferase
MAAPELPRAFHLQDTRIRLLTEADSLADLTALLHRAFAPLGAMGLDCDSATQSAATTAARARRGACFVALRGADIVGTVTAEMPDPANECAWYRRPRTLSLHQFAVEPGAQHHGLGTLLLQVAQRWAGVRGCRELALDTPQRATHLVAWYEAHGFRRVARLQHAGKRYRSVVLSKPVDDAPAEASVWSAPHRTFVDGRR